MELANGKHNKFFKINNKDKNRYYIEEFNAEKTKGTNNVYMLVEQISDNSTVLDIGCAQGNFGRELKKKNCKVFGVDVNLEAIEEAREAGNYEKTFVLDITDKKSREYSELSKNVSDVDAIIISDVLEHVSDPTSLLIEASKFLKENGIILISVPNIAHMDIILNLMNDKFNYQDMGILDNSHLKFFTKTSFIDWIIQINSEVEELNVDCEYLGATFYNNEFVKNIKDKYNELFNILEYMPNYNGLQILFKLTKISKEDETVELNKLKEENSVSVVDILGNILKGKSNFKQNHKLVSGERLWYEEQLIILKNGIQWHNENKEKMEVVIKEKDDYISELQNGIQWHNENKEKMEAIIKEKDDYISELQNGIQWHNENKEKMEAIIKEKDDYISELQNGIQWHNENKEKMEKLLEDKEIEFKNKRQKERDELIKLRKKIFEIENSRLWKLTRILKKDK